MARVRSVLHWELGGIVVILLCAALMARGIGSFWLRRDEASRGRRAGRQPRHKTVGAGAILPQTGRLALSRGLPADPGEI